MRKPGADVQSLREELAKESRIIFYGAGVYAERCLLKWGEDDRIIAFCDKSPEKQKEGFFGYKVISPDMLIKEMREKAEVEVVITSELFWREIKSELLANGVREEKIHLLVEYMGVSDSDGMYFTEPFITFEEEEVFVDAGCYDMTTSRKLKECCKNLKKIYAFEPDEENHRKSCENLSWFDEGVVSLFPYGVWSERAELKFTFCGTRAAQVGESGGSSIETVTIDETVGENKVTFIKMDVEGAELEALKGAKRTILRDKPKLAICIYHKPQDLHEIPLYIKSLVPDYKLYVRHHTNEFTETVLYAVL